MTTISKRSLDAAFDLPMPESWRSTSQNFPAMAAADERAAIRRLTDLPGFLSFDEQPATIPCRVRNLSARGAMIKLHELPVQSSPCLPDRFTLVLTHAKQETRIECVVMRQRLLEVGVRFNGVFQTVKR